MDFNQFQRPTGPGFWEDNKRASSDKQRFPIRLLNHNFKYATISTPCLCWVSINKFNMKNEPSSYTMVMLTCSHNIFWKRFIEVVNCRILRKKYFRISHWGRLLGGYFTSSRTNRQLCEAISAKNSPHSQAWAIKLSTSALSPWSQPKSNHDVSL